MGSNLCRMTDAETITWSSLVKGLALLTYLLKLHETSKCRTFFNAQRFLALSTVTWPSPHASAKIWKIFSRRLLPLFLSHSDARNLWIFSTSYLRRPERAAVVQMFSLQTGDITIRKPITTVNRLRCYRNHHNVNATLSAHGNADRGFLLVFCTRNRSIMRSSKNNGPLSFGQLWRRISQGAWYRR